MDFVPAALTANELQKQIDKRIHKEVPQEHMFASLRESITELRQELKTITQHIADTALSPIDELIQVQLAPWTFRLLRKQRRYSMLFAPNATTVLTFNIPGLGNVNFTPPVGWTELNFPSGTEVFLASGNPTTLIYRCTNIPLGSSVI